MVTFLRSLYPTAQASCSRRTVAYAFTRYASTAATRQQQTTTTPSPLERQVIQPDQHDSVSRSTRTTPISENLIETVQLDNLAPEPEKPDAWWSKTRMSSHSAPGNQYTGRSVKIQGGRTFQQAYRQIMGVLSRTGARKDVRDSEYFEKPHVMRNRQKSERHRRRFQEMIRGKVQMVQAIRNRR